MPISHDDLLKINKLTRIQNYVYLLDIVLIYVAFNIKHFSLWLILPVILYGNTSLRIHLDALLYKMLAKEQLTLELINEQTKQAHTLTDKITSSYTKVKQVVFLFWLNLALMLIVHKLF